VRESDEDSFDKAFRVLLNQLFLYAQRLIPRVYKDHNELLYDINMPFPPWFRVLVADDQKDNCQEVVQRYIEHAQEDYRRDSGLRAFLEKVRGDYNVARFW
jgi:hypothetical protein